MDGRRDRCLCGLFLACALRRRDPPTFALIVGTPAFILTVVAYGLNAFLAYAASFWAAPYALRVLVRRRPRRASSWGRAGRWAASWA